MTDPVEERLIDLESRLAHAERLSEELSSVIVEQGHTIDWLTAQVKAMAERLGDITDVLAEIGQGGKPPPHY